MSLVSLLTFNDSNNSCDFPIVCVCMFVSLCVCEGERVYTWGKAGMYEADGDSYYLCSAQQVILAHNSPVPDSDKQALSHGTFAHDTINYEKSEGRAGANRNMTFCRFCPIQIFPVGKTEWYSHTAYAFNSIIHCGYSTFFPSTSPTTELSHLVYERPPLSGSWMPHLHFTHLFIPILLSHY